MIPRQKVVPAVWMPRQPIFSENDTPPAHYMIDLNCDYYTTTRENNEHWHGSVHSTHI